MGLEEDSSDSAPSTSVQPPFTYLHVPSGLTSDTNDKGLSEINTSYGNRDNPDFSEKDAASSPQAQPYDKGTGKLFVAIRRRSHPHIAIRINSLATQGLTSARVSIPKLKPTPSQEITRLQ